MSHIVQIQTRVRDAQAIQVACHRLKWPAPQQRTAQLYKAEATGLVVEVPEWLYPLVCNTTTGELKYDNFNGRWKAQS